VNKSDLSERDICTQFITPAIVRAGWDLSTQVREEVSFTAGRVIVRGKLVAHGAVAGSCRHSGRNCGLQKAGCG